MNNLVKQRVIGAVVLVALAVIFVPMLFEQPEDELGPVGNNLPAKPEPTVRDRIEPLTLPEPPADPEAAQVVIEESAPVAVEDVPAAAAAAVEKAVEPVKAVAEEMPAAVPPAPVAETAAPASAPTPAPAPAEQAPSAPAKPLSGWVVQLASLSKKDNALALNERLRQLGYTAFVEEAKTSKGLLYRVRVGPELERSNAEKLRDRLQQQVELKGIVTSYP